MRWRALSEIYWGKENREDDKVLTARIQIKRETSRL